MDGYDNWKLKAAPLYVSDKEFDDIDRSDYRCTTCGEYIDGGEEYDCEYDDGWNLWHLECRKGVA